MLLLGEVCSNSGQNTPISNSAPKYPAWKFRSEEEKKSTEHVATKAGHNEETDT